MKKVQRPSPELIRAEDSLLLVVDVQVKLAPLIADTPKIAATIVKLIRLARILEIPVLVSRQQNLGEIIEEIRLELGETSPVKKLAFSCFGEEAFARRLENVNRHTLILTGIETHVCVAQTALATPPHIRPVVVADATAARSSFDHDLALGRLRDRGVLVTSADMLMYEWLERAGTEAFRAALPLLK